jgi:hypothetical protein
MKKIVFRDVAPCGSGLNRRATSQKTIFFVVIAVKTLILHNTNTVRIFRFPFVLHVPPISFFLMYTIYLSVYLSIYLSIYVWFYSSLLDLGRLFRFSIPYTVGRTPWTEDQPVARPLPAHITTQTQNKRTQTSTTWVRFEPTNSEFEREEIVHVLNSAPTVIGIRTLRLCKYFTFWTAAFVHK